MTEMSQPSRTSKELLDQSPLLVYSHTALYRHLSIEVAIEAIRQMGYKVTFSEDPASFDDFDVLKGYKALFFLSPSGDVLPEKQQKVNLTRYIEEGGGLVGVHSATSCLRDVQAYTKAFGAILDRHSKLQEAIFTVHNHNHPSTSCLQPTWSFKEEVYYFQSDPRLENVQVSVAAGGWFGKLLLTVDAQSYNDHLKVIQQERQGGNPHPIAWCRNGRSANGQIAYPGAPGRVWYTSLGHTNEIWADTTFLEHLRGGVNWVLGIDG